MSEFSPPRAFEDLPTVGEMVAIMDRTVAGLDEFKKRLAVVLRDFMVAALYDRSWHPGNVLIIGPTGVGKTYTLRALLDAIPVLWCEANATEYSDVGYHGRDLTSMYLGLTARHQREIVDDVKGRRVDQGTHVGRAERWGVVVLDELDKLRTNKTAVPGERQVGKVLQHELLKLVEGTECEVRENETRPGFLFATHNVLHIALGAFEGLNDVIANFEHLDWSETLYTRATPEDIVEYGFVQELAGRFATVLTLPPLKQEHLIRICSEQLVPQYEGRMKDEGVELVVDDNGVRSIANLAMQRAIGARSLEPILRDWLWRARETMRPGDRVVIDGQSAATQTARVEHRAAAQ